MKYILYICLFVGAIFLGHWFTAPEPSTAQMSSTVNPPKPETKQ